MIQGQVETLGITCPGVENLAVGEARYVRDSIVILIGLVFDILVRGFLKLT